MPDNLTCSIIIRTLNEQRYLEQLLLAIKDQELDKITYEVILVDSGSTDETVQIAERHGCRVLHIQREDFSFGRSLNVGCNAAGGEFLVFISGHCVPVNARWLRALVRPMVDAQVAVTYGRQIGGTETKFSENSIFEKYYPERSEVAHQAPFYCNNANACVRRSSWADFRFDESLTGLEDMHLAKRLFASGFRVDYVPDAVVFHFHHESWSQVRRRFEREAIALQRIMPEVHVFWSDALRYFVAGVLGDFSKAVSQRCFWNMWLEIVAFRLNQFYGVWCGNRTHRNLSHREKEKYFYPSS